MVSEAIDIKLQSRDVPYAVHIYFSDALCNPCTLIQFRSMVSEAIFKVAVSRDFRALLLFFIQSHQVICKPFADVRESAKIFIWFLSAVLDSAESS